MTPVSHPQDRPALTGPCCPVPGATPITGNVFISGTDGLQVSIFYLATLEERGRRKKEREGERADRKTDKREIE